MSTLVVDVCKVEEVKKHPNADRLQLVRVKGWWVVTQLGAYEVGDKCVYVPPDSMLTEDLAEHWNITNYCSKRNVDGETKFQVRACKLRGEPSYGTIQRVDGLAEMELGTDLTTVLGVTKYEVPEKILPGDCEKEVANFYKYTGIENLGNYPDYMVVGEEVVVTEKIHGTNCRVGFIKVDGEWTEVAGSHNHRRKHEGSVYWQPWLDTRLETMIYALSGKNHEVIVFCEIYGKGVQDMTYGLEHKRYAVFDIMIDGKYIDYDLFVKATTRFNIPVVPPIYIGPYSLSKIEELVSGPSIIALPSNADKFKGREGIVIKPTRERVTYNGNRAIAKYISADYHERKNNNRTEGH